MNIGYLGPECTFTHQAALLFNSTIENSTNLIPYVAISDVLKAVETGELEYGIVPFENSIEGTVTFTIDSLIFDVDLKIESDITLPIRHYLAVKENVNTKDIRKIISHPQPFGQCRKFLENNFHGIETVTTSSTANAAKMVSQSTDPVAAICNLAAVEKYGLEIVEKDIQDETSNKTRFFVVSKKALENYGTEGKTSIIFATDDKPGELYKILDIICIWDLNMTKIESRPMKNQLGKYVFFIDIESTNPQDLIDALKMIERKTVFFKHLGTYHSLDV